MAVDKLVDSTQLDADLTSVANAIRTKGGTSAQMAFPNGFVSAIEDIPRGGGYDLNDFATGVEPRGTITITGSLVASALANRKNITTVFLNNVTANNYIFENCISLEYIVFTGVNRSSGGSWVRSCSSLIGAEINTDVGIPATCFSGDRLFTTLVLRSASIIPLLNITAFNATVFASGGAGGTIYIPKALYDHLWDGTALDYKAATNWSTIDGYGTITWAKIEGSQYENYYVDGTPIT